MENSIKVTLIQPAGEYPAGLGTISSYLKNEGHKVDLIFLLKGHDFSNTCSNEIFDDLYSLCKDSDLIGFSIMTNFFVYVTDITRRLKEKTDIPVIYGGIHPTVKPLECLEHADMVCLSEGEEAMLELSNRLKSQDITDIKNIWLRKGNKIIRNDLRPLEQNLDRYAFPDYDMDTNFIVSNNRIVKMNARNLKDSMLRRYDPIKKKTYIQYSTQTMRGCPYNCTYCGNNSLKKISNNERFLRKRSIRHVIDELEGIKKRFEFIETIILQDDTFFSRSKKDIEEFGNEYKKRINLPLEAFLSPKDANEDKLDILVEAGLFRITVGVQSACDQTLIHIYKRPITKKIILKSLDIINKYKSKLIPLYDLIIDNPYEDKKSLRETIELVARLPKESEIRLFSLNYFPGTELYERAKKDGLIKDEIKDVYLKSYIRSDIQRIDFLVVILLLFQWCLTRGARFHTIRNLLRNLLKLLVQSKIIFLFDNKFVEILILWLRKIKHKLRYTKN